MSVRVNRGGGGVCTYTHDVEIVQYTPIDIRYATFIPCEGVAAPIGRFFGGDNRTFDASSPSYRSAHFQRISPSFSPIRGPYSRYDDPHPDILPNANAPFGETTEYDATGAQLVAGYCNVDVFGQPIARATATASCSFIPVFEFGDPQPIWQFQGSHCMTVRRETANSVRVELFLAGVNPLFSLACAIDAKIVCQAVWLVDPTTGSQRVQVSASGQRDQYPAHELYVNGVVLHRYDPAVPQLGPEALCNTLFFQNSFGPVVVEVSP